MAARPLAFLSYSHRYKEWVSEFHRDLEASLEHASGASHEVYLDQVDLGSGHSWVSHLQAGVAQARHFILVVTPEAIASPRVRVEWQSFLTERGDWLEGYLHVVELVSTPLPPFPDLVQRIDFKQHDRRKYEAGLRRLTGALVGERNRDAFQLDLPADLEPPDAPSDILEPALRTRLIEQLTPLLQKKRDRQALCPALNLKPEMLEGHPTPRLAASALLVAARGADAPAAAALRVVRALIDLLKDDEPERLPPFEALAKDLTKQRDREPERGLLAVYLAQVATDHERLVPYMEQQAQFALLDRVYVRLTLRPDETRSLLGRPDGPDAEERSPRPHEPKSLEALLRRAKERSGPTAPRWVILGDPGAGKTTLIRHLAARQAREGGREWVPVFDSLPRMMRESGFLFERITRRLRRAGEKSEALRGVLEQEARDGRLLVLLDALDEVPQEDREEAEALVRDLALRWPRVPIIVTSRPIGYRRPGTDFRELELLPLDEERRLVFLSRWFGRRGEADDPVRAEAALTSLKDDPALWELSGNPLYLTLMALILEEDKPLRHGRSALYEQIFDLLLNGRHRPEPNPMEYQDAVQRMLRHLSFCMTRDNLDAEPKKALVARLYEPVADDIRTDLERVQRWRRGMDVFLQDLAERTSILAAHDGIDADWRFWHRTFREALAAEALEEQWSSDGPEAVLTHVREIEGDESRWAEPYALLAGKVERADDLVIALLRGNPSLGLRALSTAHRLKEETFREVLETHQLEPRLRGEVLLRIPELIGELDRSLALIDELRRETRNGNDLYFLQETLQELMRLHPASARAVEEAQQRLFDHIPMPEPDLFSWIATPKDGRAPLWREIPAGEFWMGSPDCEGTDLERPRHRVRVLRSFAMGSVPVTNAQYAAFDPAKEPCLWGGVSQEELAFHPRVKVTWYEAVSFCRWLSQHVSGARLPTEVEWEYACRAGAESAYWSGHDEVELAQVEWYAANSGDRTHRVGEKDCNRWKLYDMHGNVWEWTAQPLYSYSDSEDLIEIDPQAHAELVAPLDEGRVFRGGSFAGNADWARAASRSWNLPSNHWRNLGFRVVLPAVPEL